MRSRLAALFVLLSLAAVSIPACGGDDAGASGGGGTSGSGGADGGAGAPNGPPAEGPITELPEGWNEIAPGGATTCARGDAYRFWVRPGKVDRVVIEFRGGGACWNAVTCFPDAKLFEETASPEPWVSDETKAVGIYDHGRDDNPFKDWHHVYVAYCTGDVHWGDSKQVYGAGTALESSVEHRGAVNARAVLDWVYSKVPSPDKAFVTGCSAGGYGSVYWAGHVRAHYSGAKVYHFSDSAAGIITDDFFSQSFPAWNAMASFAKLSGVDPATFKALPELYIGLGKTYPDLFSAQFNTAFDATQTKYYVAMGGKDATEWSQKMQSSLDQIEAGWPAFHSYLAPGYDHCVIDKDAFYTVEVGGTKLVDWLRAALDDQPVPDVSCTAEGCGSPKPQ